MIYHTIYTELWGILWYFHCTMSKIMNRILSKVNQQILIPDSESCYIRKAHRDWTKLNLIAQWIDCMISLCSIIACCSGSCGPVIWDRNWVKHVSCVLHSCKHPDRQKNISLLLTPGTSLLAFLMWPFVHMSEDRSSLQRCFMWLKNKTVTHSVHWIIAMLPGPNAALFLTSGNPKKKCCLKSLKCVCLYNFNSARGH